MSNKYRCEMWINDGSYKETSETTQKSVLLLLILSFRNHCIYFLSFHFEIIVSTSYPFISKSLYYFLSFHFEIIVSTSYPFISKSLLLFKKSIQSRLYHFLTLIFFLWKVFHISLIHCGYLCVSYNMLTWVAVNIAESNKQSSSIWKKSQFYFLGIEGNEENKMRNKYDL